MYCNFLGLRCLPFEDRIDTRFLYLSSACNRLLTSLEHDAHHEHGVTPVFGEAGFGKTLLIRALVARLHASDHVAVVTCPRSGAVDLLSEVGKGFGVTASPSEGAAQYTKRLHGQLVRNAQADHRSILIVDQVEELTEENLGAVSSLVELRDSTGPLLSVILFARPHARDTMNEPRFAALVQQYTHVRTIAPLNLAETQAYIEHRLAIAGSADLGMFEEGAVILIHAAAKGNPRLINQLCHATLLTAYRAEARGVSEEMASTVTTEFMQERHFTPTNLSADQTNSERATAGLPAPEPSPARQAADRSVRSPFFLTDTTESIPSLSSPNDKMSGESHGLAEPQASALTTELSVMIGRGEGLMGRLELLLTRVDAAGSAGSHDDGLAQDAEERLVELLEKTQRTCDRADRTESRLSRFAEELGDQAEIVQKRIGQLMDNLQAGETLQDEIRQTIQQATAEAAATSKEIEAQKQALDQAISDARNLTSEEIEAQKQALNSAMSEARKLTNEGIEAQKQTLDKTISEARKRTSEEIEAQKHALNSAMSEARKLTNEGIEAQKQALDKAISEARNLTSEEIEAQKHALDSAISDARKRETEIVTHAWNDCRSKISESFEEKQRVHDEMAQQTRRELQVVAEELVGKSRDVQAQAVSIEKRFVAMTQETDDRVSRWREELARAEANLNSQLASLKNTNNELEQQSETEERARQASIKAIEGRLRAAMSQSAQSVTKSEEAAERHDKIARHLFVDLQEKCEQAQADALAGYHKVLQEKLETHTRLHDEIVASTEKKLIELDRRAAAITGRLLESSKQHAEQLQNEAGQLRVTLDAAFVECKQTQSAMVKRLQQEVDEAHGRIEKTVADSLVAGTHAVEGKLSELHEVLARTTREFDDQIDRANMTKTDLMDTQSRGENLLRETHAATGQIESMIHNVSQTLVDIGSACERVGQAREQLQSAEQVTARLAVVVDSGECLESKLDETTGKAIDLRDAFVRTSAEVETKLGQLGSHSAAAVHVLSKLSEANIEAHGVIERTAKTVKEARETGENTKTETERLIKDVSSLTDKAEAAAGAVAAGTEHAVELTKRLGKVIRVANELTGEMTSRTDEAKQSAETLNGHCTQANILIDGVGDSVHLLDGARQVQTDLVESIDQARAIDAELRSAADDAILKQAQLESTRQSASELIEAHEQLSARTGDLIAQLDQGVADARSTTDASQQLLDQFTRHGKTLHDVLDTLGRRAAKLEESLNEMTEKPSAIVAEARAQAAQLDQVCTAVGKVFAKLSKASLEAHEQTKEFHQASETAFERLEQLRRETDGTSRSLQTWVKQTLRVGSDLAQSLGATHTNLQAPPAHEQAVSSSQSAQGVRIADRRATGADLPENGVAESDRSLGRTGGDILKTAEAPRSIENPAALSMAHKPSREREIAGIIADAKAADSAKT